MKFSLLKLLGLVAIAAAACGAIANAQNIVVQVLAPLVCVTCLLLSASGAIYFRQRLQSFCVGFALFGIGYVLFAYLLSGLMNIALVTLLFVELWFGSQAVVEDYAVSVVHSSVVLSFALFGGLMTMFFHSLTQKKRARAVDDA